MTWLRQEAGELGYPIHFILISGPIFIYTGVWHTLHVVGGHKGAAPYHIITLQVVGNGVDFGTCGTIML